MNYDFDSPFWAIEGEVILEVANFKEEGLVTPEGWEGEKEILVHARNHLGEMLEYWPLHCTIQTLLSEGVDFNKVYYVYNKSLLYNKSSNFTNPSLSQVEMIEIGHKSLPIIIGPYSCQRSCQGIFFIWQKIETLQDHFLTFFFYRY